MEPSVVFLLKPRRPGDAVEVWHVVPKKGGAAQVIVERDGPAVHAGGVGRPFGAPLARLAKLVEAESSRVLPAASQTAKRLRELSRTMVA